MPLLWTDYKRANVSHRYCKQCVPDWIDRECFGLAWFQMPCEECGSRVDVLHFPGDPIYRPSERLYEDSKAKAPERKS